MKDFFTPFWYEGPKKQLSLQKYLEKSFSDKDTLQ